MAAGNRPEAVVNNGRKGDDVTFGRGKKDNRFLILAGNSYHCARQQGTTNGTYFKTSFFRFRKTVLNSDNF